jgi:hypothetical protein
MWDDATVHYIVRWEGDPEDVSITTSGVAVVRDLDAMMKEVIADERYRDGLKILIDHTQTDWSILGAADLQMRADLIGEIADPIGRQQVAFVVSGRLNHEIAKMLGARLGPEVGIVAKAFTSLDEARDWLRHEPDLADVDFPRAS